MKRYEVRTHESKIEIDADEINFTFEDLTFIKNTPTEKFPKDFKVVAQFKYWHYWKLLGEIIKNEA